VQRRCEGPDVWYLVGEMENALATGQMAVQAMTDLCANYAFVPDVATATRQDRFTGRFALGFAPADEPPTG
jgi:hypothetical protein